MTLSKEQLLLKNSVYIVSDKWHSEKTCELLHLEISTNSLITKIKNVLSLIDFVNKKKIDVIHCHSRAATKHGFWIAKFTKACLVTTFHGRHHSSFSKKIFNTYGQMQIAICENIKIAHVNELKVSSSAIHVIENPVLSIDKNKKNEPVIISNRKKLALIGRSSGPKGEKIQQIIMNCAEFWLTVFQNLEIHIIAPSPENFNPRFHQKVRKLCDQYDSRVIVLGAVDNLAAQLNEYDAVIASGRIAIECLISQVSCFACGEYDYHGQVSIQSFEACLKSNFGDIGFDLIREKPLDHTKIQNDIYDFFKSEDAIKNSLNLQKETLRQIALEKFNTQNITKMIEDVYKAARFKKFFPNNIPVLMYHKIPNANLKTKHRIFVTRKTFENHLQWFSFLGFKTIHFSALKKLLEQGPDTKDIGSKFLILTFDDGYVDNLTNAQPLLTQYNHKAVIYLLSKSDITHNTWDTEVDHNETTSPLMSEKERQLLNLNIFEIGSHGIDHSDFTNLSEQDLIYQMQASKEDLEKEFGKPIISLAYPFGRRDKSIEALAKKCGYDFAVNTDSGAFHLIDEPHSIFRVNIFPNENYFSLWKKTSSWYRKHFYKKHGR